MKLDKVSIKTKGWILEEIEDANKPTKVEPEKVEPVLNDEQKALADREEKIKRIIAKRLEANKKAAEETKAEDHHVEAKPMKEKLCKTRKEVAKVVESLKSKGIKWFVSRVNEGDNRYKVSYKLNEKDCANVDIEALEWYVKNFNEGDNITVTSDLLNVLEQSLEMYKKHCGKNFKEDFISKDTSANESEVKEEAQYKVGDRVRIKPSLSIPNSYVGRVGAIKSIVGNSLEVKFDSKLPRSGGKDTIMLYTSEVEPTKVKESIKEGVSEDGTLIYEVGSNFVNRCKEINSAEHSETMSEMIGTYKDGCYVYFDAFDDKDGGYCQYVLYDKEGHELAFTDPLNEEEVIDEFELDDNHKLIVKVKEIEESLEEGKVDSVDWFESVKCYGAPGDKPSEIYQPGQGAYCLVDEDCFLVDSITKREREAILDQLIDGDSQFSIPGTDVEYEIEFAGDCDWDEAYPYILKMFKRGQLNGVFKLNKKQECKEDAKRQARKFDSTKRIVSIEEIKKEPKDESLKEVEESKKEKKQFAKKVVRPGVGFGDDDIDAQVQVNEAEAHAMIGDKPIVEEKQKNNQKSEVEMANDFANTTMSTESLQSLEDDDNI